MERPGCPAHVVVVGKVPEEDSTEMQIGQGWVLWIVTEGPAARVVVRRERRGRRKKKIGKAIALFGFLGFGFQKILIKECV